MKLSILLTALLLVSIPYNSIYSQEAEQKPWFQTSKPMICSELNHVLHFLESQYKEVVKMQIETPVDGIYSLILHSPNNTVTILETNGKIACVLSTGKIELPGAPA